MGHLDFPNGPTSAMTKNQKHQREESFTAELSTSPDSNKRLKTLTLTLTSSPYPSEISGSGREKGKEKIEEEDDDGEMDSTTCGICLSEVGKAIRGQIDSCDHYFCFVCIMEWAKLESRCPMCKQRFKSIRRPQKDGMFASERIVDVPVRDQVYHPLGNGTTGPSDPYAHVCCTKCQSSEEESLLLLCDLCDSAAHTYCVGLGFTVPEGDWYCHDCNVSRNEHSSSQLDTDCCDQAFPRSFGTMPMYETNVSISEIVLEETTLGELGRHFSINNQMHGNQVGHDRLPGRGQSQSSSLLPERSSSAAVSVREPEQGARTLHQRRNLHGRIRALRENWNALRNGSVNFSTSICDSVGISNGRRHNRTGICDNSSESRSVVSMTMGEDSVSTDVLNRRSYDAERAWKMMEIAKSIKGATGGTGSDHHRTPNSPASKRNAPKEARNKNSSSSKFNGKPSTHEVNGGIITSEKFHRHHSVELVHKECKSNKCEKQKPVLDKDMQQIDIRFPASHLSGYCQLQSSKQEMKTFQEGVSHLVMHGQSDLDYERDVPLCSVPITDSLPIKSDVSLSRTNPILSSGCKMDPSRRIVRRDKKAKGTQRKDDGAKGEVQSLVKLNLKLLRNNTQLGPLGFMPIRGARG